VVESSGGKVERILVMEHFAELKEQRIQVMEDAIFFIS